MSLIWIKDQSKMVEMADTEGNEVEYQGLNADAAAAFKQSFETALFEAARKWWDTKGNQLYDTLFEFQTNEHEGDNDVQDTLFHHVKEIAQDLSMPWAIENQNVEENPSL